MKKKEVKAFMAGVEPDKLPTIKEAKALQETRQRERKVEEAQKPAQETTQPEPTKPEAPDAWKQPPEASKFLPPDLAQKLEQPAPAPQKPRNKRRKHRSSCRLFRPPKKPPRLRHRDTRSAAGGPGINGPQESPRRTPCEGSPEVGRLQRPRITAAGI